MHPTLMTTTAAPAERQKKTPTEPTRIVVPFEVKATSTKERTFEGNSATTGRDLGGDIIHPGAFTRTLDHWRASGGPEGKGPRVINLLDQHAYKLSFSPSVVEHTLGRLIDAEERTIPAADEDSEDQTVLWSKFLVARTSRGNDLLALIEDRHATRLSIGWRAVRFDFTTLTDDEGNATRVRNVYELFLGEVSAVMFGMNPVALIDVDSVKSFVHGLETGGELTDDDRKELKAIQNQIGTLLEPKASTGADGPAVPPDDPRRRAAQATMREIELRQLARPLARVG